MTVRLDLARLDYLPPAVLLFRMWTESVQIT